MRRPPAIVLVLVPSLLALIAVATATAAAPPDLGAAFDEVHATVARDFLDAELGGLDWDAIGRAYRGRAAGAETLDELGVVVNEMLARLETSHTRLYTSREPAYYQLLSIFATWQAEAIRTAHPDNVELRYPGIAIFTTRLDEGVFVSGVLEGGPAHAAGLRVGDRIVAVDGAPFHPIGSFEGRVGEAVAVEIQRSRDPASRATVEVRPALIDPAELFVTAMRESVRVIERGPLRIGYVHAWSYAGEPYHDLLQSEIAFGRLSEADALVLDLRGGWGGANPVDLSLFYRKIPVMTHVMRDGSEREIDFQWRRPAALLVDGGSRSGKEVFAYGFAKHAIGPVVGSRTAGAVVGGRPYLVRPGVLLYLAVIDVRIDGERLEGRGVTPDVEADFTLPYAAGADPQLEAALDAMTRAAAGRGPVNSRD
jgi:carboxyl-terminal processing protease